MDIAPAAFKRGIDIGLAENGDVTISGNSDLISNALRNLADNVMRYSPNGAHVQVSVAKDGDMALVRLTDRGPGISPEDQIKSGRGSTTYSATTPLIEALDCRSLGASPNTPRR